MKCQRCDGTGRVLRKIRRRQSAPGIINGIVQEQKPRYVERIFACAPCHGTGKIARKLAGDGPINEGKDANE